MSELPIGIQRSLKLRTIMREHIERVYLLEGGDISRAAKTLGVGRSTVYRYLKKLKLERSV